MTDEPVSTTFRGKQEPPKGEITPVAAKSDSQAIVDSVEVPYLDYKMEHGHPLAVDYFNLGDRYDVFNSEIGTIESYFKGKIEDGVYANSVETVKSELKKMEKLLDIKGEERPVVKIGILASHIKFLMDTDGIKLNMRKYNGGY